MGSAEDYKKRKRPTEAERRLVDELCVEGREKEWQEYVNKVTAEIQMEWTKEDYERHMMIHDTGCEVIQWNTRLARKDHRGRGQT